MRVPHAPAPEQLERLKAEEKARAQELQRDGRWRHLWRVAGTLRASCRVCDAGYADDFVDYQCQVLIARSTTELDR